MFTRLDRLEQRTPSNGVDRFNYLRRLTEEFRITKSADSKGQVLANLANFAYDPINYGFLRSLCVIDMFLDQLSENNGLLVQFAIGGLCNLALDPENKNYIHRVGGINSIINCLTSSDEETVLSTITTLMYLITPHSKNEITTDRVISCMKKFSVGSNLRLKNLAVIFLEDYCSKSQRHPVPDEIVDDDKNCA